MNHTRFVFIIIVILLGACSEKIDKNPVQSKAVKIINRHIQAAGGEMALKQLHTRVIDGHVTDDRPYRGTAITIPFKVIANDRGEWRFDSEAESFGCDASGGWRTDSSGVHEDQNQCRSKLGFVFSPAGFLFLEHYFKDITYGRSMEMNYRLMDGLYNDRDLTYYALWFDRESGLLSQIGYHWIVTDYQKVDGILIPHLIEVGRKGGAIRYTIDRVQHNIEIAESSIQRPAL